MTEEKKKRQIKQKVAVLDLDDTLIDFVGGLCELYNKHYNTTLSPSDLTEWDWKNLDFKDARGNIVKGSELRKLFLEYEGGLYVGLRPLPYTIQALTTLRKFGYKILILTARHSNFGKMTELNLMFEKIPHDAVFHKDDLNIDTETFKVNKIKELSKTYNIVFFIDDKASTVQAIYDNCKVDKVYLLNKPHNKNAEVSSEILRVDDIYDPVKPLKDVSE